MTFLRIGLILSTLAIWVMTVLAVATQSINWPVVYFGDLVQLDWRSQFNTDLLVYIVLLSIWMAWREGFSAKGFMLGFLNTFLGGMFGFPYLLYITYQAQGNPKEILLGIHHETAE